MVFCTLFCFMSFFDSNYKKEKKIYNNNHKKESWGKNSGILRLANKQSQHSTSTYLRREMKGTKIKTKKISAYGRKKNQRNWHL